MPAGLSRRTPALACAARQEPKAQRRGQQRELVASTKLRERRSRSNERRHDDRTCRSCRGYWPWAARRRRRGFGGSLCRNDMSHHRRLAADVEAVARRIHAAGLRAAFPFVCVSADTLPTDATPISGACASLIDAGRGGSLLVTNVEAMPTIVQESLVETLAQLQSASDPLDAVRLIAWTTVILHDCVVAGTFSERLFYRLNIIHIVLPGCFCSTPYVECGNADKRRVASSLRPRRSHQRSTFRIVSDMVGGGALQSRTMSRGGASETTARRVHPAKERVPDM